MKRVKPFIAVILISVILFSFTGCIKIDFSKFKKEATTLSDTNPYNTQVYNDNTPDYNNTDTATSPDETQGGSVVSTPATSTATPVTQAESTTVAPTSPTTIATAPTVTDTGVTTYTAEYGGKTQTVFYSQSILNTGYTYPVLIFANGTGFDYKIYEKLLIKLAENGYIVVANSETMSADGTSQIASLDFIISENTNSSSVLCGKINTEKAAAVGHSQGGRSAVNAAVKDSRFDCVLSLAGSSYVEEAEPLRTPALFMAGTRDMIVAANKWVKPAYDVAKGPAVYVSLVDGVHTSCCTNPDTYTKYAVEWFDLWLKSDNSARATFKNGGALSNDALWTEFNCKNL
ncbi:MAG: dienelactone hydrolase family protein [Clostridia bacterium]|nr:dienelactone hydrolase family protein [Clostridia bacterium]